MKQAEISVGKCYLAKVNDRTTVVQVDTIRPGFNGRNLFYLTNLRTNRQVTFRSAAKFIKEVPRETIGNGLDQTLQRH